MVCFKCDRCGETYDFYGGVGESGERNANSIWTKIKYPNESLAQSVKDFHLCSDCMDSFNRWLTNQKDAETESFVEQTESSLKETFVSVYDVWGMVADVIIRCTENINNMDKERKRNG